MLKGVMAMIFDSFLTENLNLKKPREYTEDKQGMKM
jgi:hypothetical protein